MSIFVCGDTGICGFSKEQELATREYLRKLPMTVLFVDGNHERFDTLNDYPVDECHDEALEQVRFFQKIADNIGFQDWYFGHFHEDVDVDNFHCRIDEVTLLD